MHDTNRTRKTWPFAGLLPHSIKVYPIVQVAPEVGAQAPAAWPPRMDARVARWRASVDDYPTTGNQIYLHVPFCPFICHFCPLYKMRLARSEEHDIKERFVRGLISEIELYGARPAIAATTFHAIYFGGGTPSELTPQQLQRVLEALRRNLTIAPNAEITLEGVARQLAAPDYAEMAIDAGFNRFSWGVQSLDLERRKRIGRGDQVSDYTTLLGRIRSASDAVKVNCEIMAGLPEQTFDEYQRGLRELISWQMDSVDILYYVPMPGTKLSSLVDQHRREAPLFGSRLLGLRDHTNRTLTAEGYRQVTGEVFVRNERDLFVSTGFGGGGHSLNTHLALGPSGFGHIHGTVYQNVCDLDRWHVALQSRRFPIGRARRLNLRSAMRRATLLSLIQLQVPDFLVTGPRMRALVWRWKHQGLIRKDGATWHLTAKGALWYNSMQIDVLSIYDLVNVMPMFGSSKAIQEKLSSQPPPDSEAYELQQLVRYVVPFMPLRGLPYKAAVKTIGRLNSDRAVGFTGPLGETPAADGAMHAGWNLVRKLISA